MFPWNLQTHFRPVCPHDLVCEVLRPRRCKMTIFINSTLKLLLEIVIERKKKTMDGKKMLLITYAKLGDATIR